tara:strand:+ start:87 stop:470 length:384 start_codon:yes stop_codon:yes gene_type:complete
MKKIFICTCLLLLLTCAKEDSQDSKIYYQFSGAQYTLSVVAGDGGTFNAAVCPSVDDITDNVCRNLFHNSDRYETSVIKFPAGVYVAIKAFPNEGYSFSGWSNGSTDNPISVLLNSNVDIEVYFTQD